MTKLLLFITLLTVLPIQVWPQNDVRADQTTRLRTVIRGFGQEKTGVTLLTRSLVRAKGKIVRSREDSFDIKVGKITSTIFYGNVLEMKGGDADISFVANPQERNYGSWEDIGRVYAATKFLVILVDGKSIKGFSNSASETHLIMIDQKGRERMDVPREQIAAVYGLIGGYGGVREGASKGSDMHAGRDKLLDAAFVGIGALVGLVKSDGRPILIYSK